MAPVSENTMVTQPISMAFIDSSRAIEGNAMLTAPNSSGPAKDVSTTILSMYLFSRASVTVVSLIYLFII